MSDQSAAQALREIIFASDNIIDWDRAFEAIQKYMPELKMFDQKRGEINENKICY